MLKYYRTDPNQVKKVVNDYLDPAKKVERDRNMRFVNDLMKLDYKLNTMTYDLDKAMKEFTSIIYKRILEGD